MNETTTGLSEHARRLRMDVVDMIYQAKDGHGSPALSAADILAVLYFEVMNLRPADPGWPDRDRFILSKGHACAILYAALARRGYFSPQILRTFRSLDSPLQGHPDTKKTRGVDATTGSLGNGLSIGLGMAAAARLQGRQYYTYVLAGDGELQEGVVWEAAMAASKMNPGRLILIIDHNGYQSGGRVAEVSGLVPIAPKFEAFGWHCQEIDGHDCEAILAAVRRAQEVRDRPAVIVARTTKGRGVSFMAGTNAWHKRVFNDEEYAAAMRELAE